MGSSAVGPDYRTLFVLLDHSEARANIAATQIEEEENHRVGSRGGFLCERGETNVNTMSPGRCLLCRRLEEDPRGPSRRRLRCSSAGTRGGGGLRLVTATKRRFPTTSQRPLGRHGITIRYPGQDCPRDIYPLHEYEYECT